MRLEFTQVTGSSSKVGVVDAPEDGFGNEDFVHAAEQRGGDECDQQHADDGHYVHQGVQAVPARLDFMEYFTHIHASV